MDTNVSSANAVDTSNTRNRICIRIDGYKHAQDHIKYCIVVSINGVEHKVYRRYKEFNKFRLNLKETLRNLQRVKGVGNIPSCNLYKSLPNFPGKKMYSNFCPDFLEKRRGKLQSFLTAIVANPILTRLMCTLDFLQIPTSLNFSSEVTSLQGSKHVSKIAEFLSFTDLASINYLPPNGSSTDISTLQDGMLCKSGDRYLLQGVSDIVCLLRDEPWWEDSFRIFQHHCGAGIFATQLLYWHALKRSNGSSIAVSDAIKGLGLSIVGVDDNNDAVMQFKENIQRLRMTSKAKAILHHGDTLGAGFSGVYDVFLSVFSLRRVFSAAASCEMLINYFKNIRRTLKSQGYVIICEIADLVYTDTSGGNSDKSIRNWLSVITKICTDLRITIIREHKLFIRKAVRQKGDFDDKASTVSVPCVVFVGRMPQRPKRGRHKLDTL